MSFNKTKIFMLLACSLCGELKGENYPLSYYLYGFRYSGCGFETIAKYYKSAMDRMEEEGRSISEVDITAWEYEKYYLSKTLLNKAVMEHVESLSESNADIVLRSHQAWLKHFNKNYKSNSLNMKTWRLRRRYAGVELPWESYLLYAKIGNMCKVRLYDRTIRMRFGEVCYKDYRGDGSSYYLEIPAELLPETCVKVSNHYAAVIKSLSVNIEERRYFLCVWDATGEPIAVHLLAFANPNNYLEKIDSCKVVNNQIEVIGVSKYNDILNMSYDVNKKNNNYVSDWIK